MRIIGGKWRSRPLSRPQTKATRPVPDRVKEAIFDILGSQYGCPGSLPPFRVADVFAGSGSMGLEALSRGAVSCCFFERDPEALRALRSNLVELSAGEMASVVTRNAWRCAEMDENGQPFDLVFLDPPYRDSDDPSGNGQVHQYLQKLGEQADQNTLVLLHHRAKTRFEDRPDALWQIVKQRKFGSNAITLFAQ